MGEEADVSPERVRGFKAIASLLRCRAVSIPLLIFEHMFAFFLTLPVPGYSHMIYMLLKPLNGFIGFYLRALYYSRKAKGWGGNIVVREDVVFENIQEYEIEEFVLIDRQALICPRSLKIGRGSHFSLRATITGGGHVEIGRYVGLGINSIIVSATERFEGGHRVSGPMVPSRQRNVLRPTTVIENDAFLATNVVVLPGVRVGEGGVITPGSTIRRDVPPWTVWGPVRSKNYFPRERVRFDEPEY
jgi:acetyltransferase-like isoleucine patch superfamily enzyme